LRWRPETALLGNGELPFGTIFGMLCQIGDCNDALLRVEPRRGTSLPPISDEEAPPRSARRSTSSAVVAHGRTGGTLLDLPIRSYRGGKRAKSAGSTGTPGRLSNLIGIHKALRIIFSEPHRATPGCGRRIPPSAAERSGGVARRRVDGSHAGSPLLDSERGGW